MPSKEGSKVIAVTMSDEEKDVVEQLAEGHNSTAEYLRKLIEKDAKSRGVNLKFGIKWGGNRYGKGK